MSFFLRCAQSPGAYGFDEGAGFDVQEGRDGAGGLSGIQLALRLLEYRFGQDGRSARDARGKEALHALVTVLLDGTFDGDLRYPKGSGYISLLGARGDMQLRDDESK